MEVTISKWVMVLIATVGLAMMFKKMGIEWWKAFIPVYGEYVLFKEVWNTKMFWVSVVNSVALGFAIGGAQAFAHSHNVMAMTGLAGVAFVTSVAAIVLTVKLLSRVSKAFGHGTGYTVGLAFLSPVFFNVLGFGKSQYQAA